MIHKIPDHATFEDFEEVSRCYAEIYDLVVFLRGTSHVMTRVEGPEGPEVFVTEDLLQRIRGSYSNPFYIDTRCRVHCRPR